MTNNTTHPMTTEPDWDYEYDMRDICQDCGGEGWIEAADGDPSDWGEDTYCGAADEVITCRHCNGSGVRA